MTDKEFRAEIKNGLSGGYFVFGDEDYIKKHIVDLAVKSVVGDDDFSSVNILENDENSFDVSFVFDAVSAVPMMAEKCAALCRVRYSELKESEKEGVLAALGTLKDNPSVVFIMVIPSGYFNEGDLKKGKPSADYKALEKYLAPVACPYQTPAVLKKWVEKHFASDGLRVTYDALDYMIDTVGSDMNFLLRETEKVACFAMASGSDTVDRKTVETVCSEAGELDAFALSGAIVSGDREGALSALRECRDKRQKPQYVIARMTSEFMNMFSVSVCMNSGMVKDEISKKLGIHEYRVGKYMAALKDTEVAAVRAVIERAVEIDNALKTSGGGFDLLERFVCTIPAKKRSGGGYGR
ncbi:MAG: DNA polymerase III subunit delta [Clostridia bacterium]|nr:DNA polymerase III subunit delta [Clostridia bacterium]